nr:hypothetical protein [Tanacetum cinerariifolium]
VTNGSLLDTPEACQDLVDHAAPSGYFTELRHMHNDEFLRQYNVNLARQVAMGSQLRLRFEQEAKLLKKSVAQVARRDKRIQDRELEIKNLEALLETEAETKRAAEDKNAELMRELKDICAQLSGLKVSNEHLSQRVAALQEQVSGEEKLKAAFEEFKRYEDDRVKQRRLPMLCPQGLLRLEGLKDAPMDVIMAALYLERDTGGDAPQYICDICPNSSHLTIPVYPEVRDPRNPWACKEEIALADAIAANISRAEKKKKFRIVCRTHEVGSTHHARSDGVPVSVPSVVPQGLALLLVDGATKTDPKDSLL